jgi:hypothetical protein
MVQVRRKTLTRRYEKRRHDDIVRRCRCCCITNNDMPFLVQRDSKTGKFYTHSLCRACETDIKTTRRREYYNAHQEQQIKEARKWNVENRERYNARRRKSWITKWTKERVLYAQRRSHQ